MLTIRDVVALPPAEIDARWEDVDRVVAALPTNPERLQAWEQIAQHLDRTSVSRGMPFFRLGVLHLVSDPDEAEAIKYLEAAYSEDQRFGPEQGRDPTRMGAYRLLALLKGFLAYLREEKDWKSEQLQPAHRPVLMKALLSVYDNSLVHILDTGVHTYPVFQTLIQNRNLCRFAIENYFCAITLLEMFSLQNQHIDKHRDEYPLARAIVGLLGGVLEAILADRLPASKSKTLGTLIRQAESEGVIETGSILGALSSLMLYLRNHIHADRDANRTEYFIDINVAQGCKIALDWLINQLLPVKQTVA